MKRNKQTPIVLVVLFLVSTIGVVDGAINLISNPGFESGTASWGFYTSGTGTFTAVPPGHEGSNAARLAFDSGASNIQLYQTGVTLEANTRYRLSFWAYSSTGHDMTVRLFKHASPYTTYMPEYTANLGTSWLNFTHEFNSTGFSGTVSDGRLMFWFAPFVTAGDIYYIDDIRLEKVEADRSPPIVIGNTPVGTGVPVNTQITVTFNESMNKSSANSSFSTSPATTGSFAWSGNMMTFTNDSNLLPNTTYNVTVGTGAKDLAGNNMQSSYKWNFTTASVSDTSPPIVTGNTPTGINVPVTTQITVTFNESMNKSSAQSAFSTLPGTTGSFAWSGNMMTFTNDSSLLANTTYNVTVGTGAKDLAGNSLQKPYNWSFTTGGVPSSIEARLAALENRVTNLETENTALKSLLANVSRNGSDIYIDGANVHIRDGSNDTDGPVNGLGNLIIGYNELRDPCPYWPCTPPDNNRTGSHNLILGTMNNYMSYGGLVAGNANHISGAYASVSGGFNNYAMGERSSISGGYHNVASGEYSSISGGAGNKASGSGASVSGGYINIASGSFSSVSGGYYNNASGQWSSISGGETNTASGESSSVSGGGNYFDGPYGNSASGKASWIGGGYGNRASGTTSSVSGGESNTASGAQSSVSGGTGNTASGWRSWVGGGIANTASNFTSSVSGGTHNTAKGDNSSVSGGFNNTASGPISSVSGGWNNAASGAQSSVSGGTGNTASGWRSWVGGGIANTASNFTSSVSGGDSNTASGERSSVSGGEANEARGSWSWIGGGGGRFDGGPLGNTASGDWSSVSGGRDNSASGESSSVSGGFYNAASGRSSSVSGGFNNAASGVSSSISGGFTNAAKHELSSVSGGEANEASGLASSVSGGWMNKARGWESSVSGGSFNIASGDWSSVSGGYQRNATGIYDWWGGGSFQDQ